MNMKKAFVIISVVVLASVGNAKACKCVTAAQEFAYAAKNSPLIFSGQLVSVTNVNKSGAAGAYTVRVFKFVPDKVWRGTKADTITLVSGNNNCDVELGKGRYIIYTNPTRDFSRCDRTAAGNIGKETEKLNQLFTRKRFKQLQAAK